MRKAHTHRLAIAAMAASLLVGGLAACGDDDDGGATTTTAAVTTSTTEATTTTSEPATQHQVRAYFMRGEVVGPVGREVTGDAVAAGAMTALLEGPAATEASDLGLSTAIPEGTELLGVTVADGVATVDLSAEFATGGGSLSMMARVAEVVFTLTQFPTIESVSFELEGEPLTTLGGEGLILDHPQTRADWEDLSPVILVESPLPGEAVTSPLQITGTANTFEAAFVVNVVDGEGLIVYDQPAMATSGTGTRGTFDVTATFEVVRAGAGSVILFERSAKDGSQINVVEIPVQIS